MADQNQNTVPYRELNKNLEGINPDLFEGSGRPFNKARISANALPTYFGKPSHSIRTQNNYSTNS